MRSAEFLGLGTASVLLAATLGLGCAGEAASAAPPATVVTTSAADDEPAADLTEHHRHHHHGGVTLWIAMSLDSLGLPPDQQAKVEKVQADLFSKMEPGRAAEQALVNAIADGVASGVLDQAKLDAAVAQVAAASGTLHDASVAALNELHALLTPEQRGTLVDKVGAHWSVWKTVNGEQDQAGQDQNHDGVVSASEMGHLERLGKELGLAPDQVEKARAAFSARVQTGGVKLDAAAVEAHIRALESGFRADTFDAKTLQGAPANTQVAGWGARRMAYFYTAITPVLTPEQRSKLAAKLRGAPVPV